MMNKMNRLTKGLVNSIAALTLVIFHAQAIAGVEQEKPSVINISDDTFTCMRDMTKVDGFYVGNLLGDVAATVKVAQSASGGVYPTGSVIQLVPSEVMVKHHTGFSPVTNDWEFFELDVSPQGSKIINRGFADVINRFGGNCLDCHVKAEPQWDMVCKTGHGCEPIPLSKQVLALLQKTDPRCKDNVKLTDDEVKILIQLEKSTAALLANKN